MGFLVIYKFLSDPPVFSKTMHVLYLQASEISLFAKKVFFTWKTLSISYNSLNTRWTKDQQQIVLHNTHTQALQEHALPYYILWAYKHKEMRKNSGELTL
jgi:hypothetical protein